MSTGIAITLFGMGYSALAVVFALMLLAVRGSLPRKTDTLLTFVFQLGLYVAALGCFMHILLRPVEAS